MESTRSKAWIELRGTEAAVMAPENPLPGSPVLDQWIELDRRRRQTRFFRVQKITPAPSRRAACVTAAGSASRRSTGLCPPSQPLFETNQSASSQGAPPEIEAMIS